MNNQWISNPLERRLVSHVVVGMLVFSIVAGLVTYYFTYTKGVAEAKVLQHQLIKTVHSQAQVGAFVHNHEILRDVIEGLLINPVILAVRLETEDGFVMQRATTLVVDFSLCTTYPLMSPVDPTEKIGNLLVVQNDDAINAKVTANALNSAMLLVGQVVITTIILITYFRRLFGKPVADLAYHMLGIQPGSGVRLTIPKVHQQDEIGLLSSGVNLLLEAAEHAIDQERQLRDELARSMAAVEAANRAKSEFLATMSHEIRTPMNVVIGMGDVLMESGLNEEQLLYVGKIQKAGNTLLELINQILDLTKIEAGQFVIVQEPVNIHASIQEVADLLAVVATGKGLELTCLIEKTVPPWMLSDRLRLRQILFNLLGNAVKFTEHGTVSLRVWMDYPASLHVVVRDSGIGIDVEHVDHIFEIFAQADAGITRRYGGTGLGLTISRRLVELMGGQIRVESQQGRGSAFHVTLPFIAAQPPDSAAQSAKMEDVCSVQSGVNILLVEDSPDNQLLVQTFLKKSNHCLTCAWDGEEAVKLVKEKVFDLVFMDVQMPRMDGYTATRLIRNWEKETGRFPLPIVALTAHVLEGEEERVSKAGCDLYLSKPIKKQLLLGVIQQMGRREVFPL